MKKVLILEDNQALLHREADIIRSIDYKCEVMAFDNERDAMAEALKGDTDLFVVDLVLDLSHPGDTSGLSFAENVRSIRGYSFTPIIIITALEDPKLYSYEHVHCYSFMEKPFDVESLKEKVVQCLQFPGIKGKERMLKFRKDGILYSMKQDEVAYAEVSSHQMLVCKTSGEKVSFPYYTLKELINMVSRDQFVQCNRHCVINAKHVSTVDLVNGIIQFAGEVGSVEIGRAYKNRVKEIFA